MSKKNRRKTGNKIGAKPLPRVEFDFTDSRAYIIAAMLIFHIVPVVFLVVGLFMQMDFRPLYTHFAIYYNTMLTAALCFIYGLKKGFNVKFPVIITVISALAMMFYSAYTNDQILNVFLAFGITYALFSFGAILLGAFFKKTFNFD